MQVVLEALLVELKTDAQASRMWNLKDRDLKQPAKAGTEEELDAAAPQVWLWAAFALQQFDDLQRGRNKKGEERLEGLQELARGVERLVNYLYSKHLEENASPLFSPQVVVTNLEDENNVPDQPTLALRSAMTHELEALELQLSLPSVW
jgi:hypothetical protein